MKELRYLIVLVISGLKVLAWHSWPVGKQFKACSESLQRVMNAAAQLVFHSGWLTPVSGLLRDSLHWLRVPEQVGYKLCLLVFRAVHGTAPRLSHWALPIKRWRHCSLSTPFSSTQRSPWFHVQRPTLMIMHLQSPVQYHGTEYQQQFGHLTLQNFKNHLKAHFSVGPVFFFSIHIEHGRHWIGLHVTVPKKLMLYYYYQHYRINNLLFDITLRLPSCNQ